VAEPEPGDRELDRHGRYVGGAGVGLDQLPAVGEHVVEDGLLHDARQVVVPDQPLVVQGHQSARLEELLRGRHRWQLVDHPVVEPDHGEVGLGDDEVLVVARVRDQRPSLLRDLALADARQVVTLLDPVGTEPERVTGLEVQPVGVVELRRLRTARPAGVQRVEVEGRRPGLQQLRRGDRLAQLDLGHVHGEVVVDELAEVGVARRDVALLVRGDPGHRPGQLLGEVLVQPPALGADAPEPEGRRRARRQVGGSGRGGPGLGDRIGLAVGAAPHLGVDQAFPLDPEAL
jgi:hypothetical protein